MTTKKREPQFKSYFSRKLIYWIIIIQLVIFSGIVVYLYEDIKDIKDNLILLIPINMMGSVALFFANKDSAKNERVDANYTRENSPIKSIFSFIAEMIWVIITWSISYWAIFASIDKINIQ